MTTMGFKIFCTSTAIMLVLAVFMPRACSTSPTDQVLEIEQGLMLPTDKIEPAVYERTVVYPSAPGLEKSDCEDRLAQMTLEIERLKGELANQRPFQYINSPDWCIGLPVAMYPDRRMIDIVGELMVPYEGVRLSTAEGLWLVDRINKHDWRDWGPTADEAIIRLLTPARLVKEVRSDKYAELRMSYPNLLP
jgi:hypothetical protein